MRVLAVVLTLCLAPSLLQRPSLDRLLKAAGLYAERYREAFTAIVAEEHYVQRLQSSNRRDSEPVTQRTLRSDVMLLRDVAGEDGLFFFRDVFEVDGKAVTSTRGRLESWLRESRGSFVHRARALALEQARFNIGDIVRTINVPFIALEFLLPRNQERFRFRITEPTDVSGSDVVTVTYEERRRPTIIRTTEGEDVEARGTFWIDARTGRVLRTELRTGERNRRQVRATIVVTYEPHERLEMLVPGSMQESYAAASEQVTGVADYSNFRRFETDARIIR